MPPAHRPSSPEFTVHLPNGHDATCDQDAEWCIVETADESRRIRFHDYDEIFAVPGLYEQLFYSQLKCDSPRTVTALVDEVINDRNIEPAELTALDVGAGNGMVGEALADIGVGSIVGVDILSEAADATQRDRPGVYDEYRVVDLTDPAPEDDKFLSATEFDCMTSVAALGFGDIPPAAFARAYNYLDDKGLLAFTIKENFLSDTDPSGFNLLIQRMFDEGVLDTPITEHRYRHRLSVSGEPLYYLAFVAEKTADVPDVWLADAV
jgi:SAM-dependent methyltransferase